MRNKFEKVFVLVENCMMSSFIQQLREISPSIQNLEYIEEHTVDEDFNNFFTLFTVRRMFGVYQIFSREKDIFRDRVVIKDDESTIVDGWGGEPVVLGNQFIKYLKDEIEISFREENHCFESIATNIDRDEDIKGFLRQCIVSDMYWKYRSLDTTIINPFDFYDDCIDHIYIAYSLDDPSCMYVVHDYGLEGCMSVSNEHFIEISKNLRDENQSS